MRSAPPTKLQLNVRSDGSGIIGFCLAIYLEPGACLFVPPMRYVKRRICAKLARREKQRRFFYSSDGTKAAPMFSTDQTRREATICHSVRLERSTGLNLIRCNQRSKDVRSKSPKTTTRRPRWPATGRRRSAEARPAATETEPEARPAARRRPERRESETRPRGSRPTRSRPRSASCLTVEARSTTEPLDCNLENSPSCPGNGASFLLAAPNHPRPRADHGGAKRRSVTGNGSKVREFCRRAPSISYEQIGHLALGSGAKLTAADSRTIEHAGCGWMCFALRAKHFNPHSQASDRNLKTNLVEDGGSMGGFVQSPTKWRSAGPPTDRA
jgi:hypothetical protein